MELFWTSVCFCSGGIPYSAFRCAPESVVWTGIGESDHRRGKRFAPFQKATIRLVCWPVTTILAGLWNNFGEYNSSHDGEPRFGVGAHDIILCIIERSGRLSAGH